MKTLLAFSCLLAFILPNESQFVIPSLTNGIKKIASNLGIHNKPSSSPSPIQEIHASQPALGQTYQGEADHSPSKHPHVNNIDSNSVDSAHGGPNTVPSSHPVKHMGPQQNIMEETSKDKPSAPVNNLPQKFQFGSAATKNNVTAINKDGTVVFPDEEFNPNAVKINKTVDCKPGVQYPPNHPCGKLITGVAKGCPPETAGHDCVSTNL